MAYAPTLAWVPLSGPEEAHIVAAHAERMQRYADFLAIPSVSAIPEYAPDCRKAAEWLAAELRRIGAQRVEVSETGGHPIVVAERIEDPNLPTIVIYGHYDVQPGDPLDLWKTSPFEPIVRDGRMLGRGSADDKGQILIHLAALEALLSTRGKLPVNVKYLFEGEEESSSVNLERWMAANPERCSGDAVIISDSGFFDGNRPALTVGLRGITYMQVDVRNSDVDLHSGSYGGAVINPANALASMIASLHDENRHVTVPGFYDDVVELTPDDRAAFAALPFNEASYLAGIDAKATQGEAGFSTVERRGARPTLDVNGIWGGFTGDGSKTIIPAHAHAKISCRLVTAQDPAKIALQVEAALKAAAPRGLQVEVQNLGNGYPFLTPLGDRYLSAAANALKETFRADPLYIREGGSIPIAALFQRELSLPVVLLGFTPPDDNAHAPNESMDLGNFEGGIRTVIRALDAIAALR
ncbi:MAG: Succinyl-diaminopimelate desuccinylase [Chloroflexota bacterium]|jgi:acetylornithine deacetylase/succinyl-diaminopimelate desuccinylase-like protein